MDYEEGQQDLQRRHNHLRCDPGTDHEQGQAETLARAVVGNDQDRNPSRDEGELRQLFADTLPLLPPLRILLLALRRGLLALLAQYTPTRILRLTLARR